MLTYKFSLFGHFIPNKVHVSKKRTKCTIIKSNNVDNVDDP